MLSMSLVPRGATKVGVAPGTTTISFGSNPDWCPYPGQPVPGSSQMSQQVVLDPYGSIPDMKGGLGIASPTQMWNTASRQPPSMAMRVPSRMMHKKRRKAAHALGLVDPNEAWNTAAHNHVKGTTTIIKAPGRGHWEIDDVAPPYGTPWTWPPRDGVLGGASVSGSLGITNGEVNRNLSGLGWFIDGGRRKAKSLGWFQPGGRKTLGEEVIERLGPVFGEAVIEELGPYAAGLGTVPNDDELAVAYGGCYTPVHSGWVYGNKADGSPYYESGFYGAGLGDTDTTRTWLQAISTVAVTAIAAVVVGKAYKAYKKRSK